MEISGNEGGPIDFDQAKKWTANYRESGSGKTKAHLFGSETIKKLLDQEGCEAMRIYYALDDKGEQQLILVGTDVKGNDMTKGLILDMSVPCPPDCPDDSGLAG